MPFHPTYFEIFACASRLRFGHIDTDNLGRWHVLECDDRDFPAVPRHPAVGRGRDQWWFHHREDAWLAANPVLVPTLPRLLQSAARCMPVVSSSNDPFIRLPRELSDTITDLLNPVDLASLRLASCAEHLPLSDWQHLLQRDMPWLWELWDPSQPSFWVTTPVSVVYIENWKREKTAKRFEEQAAMLREDMPGIADAWCEKHAPREKSYATLNPVAFFSLAGLPVETIN